MDRELDAISVLISLGIAATSSALLGSKSLIAALVLIWASIVLSCVYQLGKRAQKKTDQHR